MPHDVNGREVKVGDEVIVRFKVAQVFTGEEYCNVNLESVIPMPPTEYKTNLAAINTRQIEVVS